jgi:hypothetical protein
MASLQPSAVHGLSSLQSLGAPFKQLPAAQVLATLHGFPSLQEEPLAALALNTHPVLLLHESTVHSFSSSHTNAVPEQLPSVHLSLKVQRLPSVHSVPFAASENAV